MTHTIGRGIALAALLLIIGSIPALAIPVAAPFGSDSMPKALIFTGAAKPTSTSRGAMESIYTGEIKNSVATAGNGIESGIIMTPVGDGSYVCTALVYPGANYNYYFAYRIDAWDMSGASPVRDSITTWTVWRDGPADWTGENRTIADRTTARSITIPAAAAHGYYIYNAYGDRTVLGYQGTDSSVMTTLNPYLANFGGVDTMGGRINRTGDTHTRLSNVSGMDTLFANNDYMYGSNYEGRVYGVTMVQTGEKQFQITWKNRHPGSGSDGFVAHVDGARYFGTQTPGADATTGGSSRYGYRVLRGDSRGVYIDITANVIGDTNWSSHDWSGAHSFTDTSVTGNTGDTFYYTVFWHTAYGYSLSDTAYIVASQAPLGKGSGYDTGSIGQAIRVFFIVEHLNENVVFPNGEDRGRMYLTPYIDGVRREDLRFPADVTRAVIRPSAV
jgi:hypothetical protein